MTISNGLALSPDGRTMYHADTPTQVITRVRLRRRDRHAVEPARLRALHGRRAIVPTAPRSTAKAAIGRALYRGGKLERIAPDGALLAEYPVPAMCPTMCAFGGRDLKTLYVTSARQQRDADELARLPQSGGIFAMQVDVAGPARTDVRRLSACARAPIHAPSTLDATAFVRLDALQSLGASASGASFATSTGDILEVSCYGPGVFRMRVGPNTQPDYGLVVGADEGVHGRARRRRRVARSRRATATLEIARGAAALSPAASRRAGRRVDHRRALPRLDAASRVRPRAPGRTVDRVARARVGRAGVRARREIRPAQQARTAHPFARRRCARRQHRPRRTRTCRSRGARGPARARGAFFVHTPALGDARRRPSRLVAPLVRRSTSTTRRSISSSSPRTRRPASSISTRSSPAAPATVPLWSLGLWVSRAYYKTPEEAAAVAAKLRAHKIPCDVLTLDGRAAWDVETRFDFEWDPDALPRSARRARRDQGAPPARLRLGIPVRVGALAAVRGARLARLPAHDGGRRSLRVRLGHRARARARSARC